MPKRKSKKSRNTSSIMVSDISNSQLDFPLATSSPRESAKRNSVGSISTKRKEFEENVAAFHRKSQEIENYFDSKISKLKDEIEELLQKYPEDLDKPAKLSDFKALSSSLSTNRTLNGTSKKKNQTVCEHEVVLPSIPEENEAFGPFGDENFNGHEKGGPSSEVDGNAVPGKKANKVQFPSDNTEDESVFKKPTGRGMRTLKNSQQYNSSSYQTPKNGRRRYNVAMVTPGPNSEKPINILRRPNPGEMAISMTGSPLLVAHENIPSEVPQISIPLSDGRVMTVIANEALDPDMSICSDIDAETCERLAVLQKLLTRKFRKN